LLSPEELLGSLVCSAAAHQNGDRGSPFAFWIDGVKCPLDETLLPNTSDVTLNDYVARMEATLNGREFTLLVANPHLFDPHLRSAARRFLRGLYPYTGMPCGGVDTGIFVGRYGKTPFGVHRGQMSVVTFPTVGAKSFRLWPRGYGELHMDLEDSLQYDKHLGASIEIVAHPGDVIYWPADFWHIAETSPGYTATWNIGFWWDRPALARVLVRLSEQLSTLPDASVSLSSTPAVGMEAHLPSQLKAALAAVHQAATDQKLERALLLDWLALISGDGFREIPDLCLLDTSPQAAGDLYVDPLARVKCARLPDGDLAIGVNGHLFVTEDSPVLRAALEEISRNRIPSAASESSTSMLLGFLNRAGWFVP
jgi:50S ribosomal protein L16 3-hydroxylase